VGPAGYGEDPRGTQAPYALARVRPTPTAEAGPLQAHSGPPTPAPAVISVADPGWAVDAWRALFFTPESPAVVALFRIAFGSVMVIDAVETARAAPVTLSPRGVFDYPTYRSSRFGRRWSLFRHLPPTEASVRVVVGLYLGAAVCVLVGLVTPLATAVAWVCLISIHARDPFVINAGSQAIRLLVFLLIFSRAGQTLSIDALIFDLDPEALVEPWALRLMQIQVVAIYAQTALWKLRDESWREGSAVYEATAAVEYRRHKIPGRLDRRWFYRAATWGTIAFELAFAVLIWFEPFRYPLLATAVAFHLSLHWFLRTQLFQWVMIASLVLFVPPDDAARWLGAGS